MKTVTTTTEEYTRVNNQKPIWLRPPKEVPEEEYASFYKAAFKSSYDDPMAYTHFNLEGQVECKSVLFIPGMLPFELSKDMFDENSHNLRLYVKRVFINDQVRKEGKWTETEYQINHTLHTSRNTSKCEGLLQT